MSSARWPRRRVTASRTWRWAYEPAHRASPPGGPGDVAGADRRAVHPRRRCRCTRRPWRYQHQPRVDDSATRLGGTDRPPTVPRQLAQPRGTKAPLRAGAACGWRGLRTTTDALMVPVQALVDLRRVASSLRSSRPADSNGVSRRPRTHPPAALARVRDCASPRNPKDTLGRLYGPAFDATRATGRRSAPASTCFFFWVSEGTRVLAGPGNRRMADHQWPWRLITTLHPWPSTLVVGPLRA